VNDWRSTFVLLPYVGLVAGDGNFLRQPATMRKLRCPQLITQAEGARCKGQYALNGYGTPTLKSGANLGIGGLFCDGHVESARQTNWVAATDGARARWNNDNQPHPETWQRR
jgi:prepilin-type processing-associated H-X9-DG protein